jgi:hypothetical protein
MMFHDVNIEYRCRVPDVTSMFGNIDHLYIKSFECRMSAGAAVARCGGSEVAAAVAVPGVGAGRAPTAVAITPWLHSMTKALRAVTGPVAAGSPGNKHMNN